MKYDIKKLKHGSKVKYKKDLYFVMNVGKRVTRVRKIFDINPIYNPYGSVSNVITSIPTKGISK